MVGIGSDVLQSTPERGKLPLLEINGSGELFTVHIVEKDSGTTYTAISHVWADGLGNPAENSLPQCQLERIREFGAVLSADVSKEERRMDARATPSFKESSIMGPGESFLAVAL